MTKRVSIKFRANGEGTLDAGGVAYPCLGEAGRDYPRDLTVTPSDKSEEHWSNEFQVMMRHCVLIWGQKGIYVHEGPNTLAENGGPSAGCIHLGVGDAKKFYDWLDERTRITIEYPWGARDRVDAVNDAELSQQAIEPASGSHASADFGLGTQKWPWSKVHAKFGRKGCTADVRCPFHDHCDTMYCCALNLSDALILAGCELPTAPDVNCCRHKRVRNADGLARICNQQNGGRPDASGWSNRPHWKGIVYFEGDLGTATGHIDLWDGTKAVHEQYPAAKTIWFWKMGE